MINVISKGKYEVFELNQGRANPIDTDMVVALRDEIKRAESDDEVRGVIITGNTPGYFSVGLNLKKLYYYDEATIINFWDHWDRMVLELTDFSKPLIAAINGYSPAGGCVIATTCDYRVMAEDEKYVIGLNEVGVGITVPENIYYLYQFWIGNRNAYHSFLEAKLHTPREAKNIGLVDEICPMDQVLSIAETKMKKLIQAPDTLLRNSKKNMRKELMTRLKNIEQPSLDDKLKAWFDPASRMVMKMLVDNLEKK